jgi:hypothetical protein
MQSVLVAMLGVVNVAYSVRYVATKVIQPVASAKTVVVRNGVMEPIP